MFSPKSLKEAKTLMASETVPPDISLPDNQHIRFTHCFKYLGLTLSTELNEDKENITYIQKAKSLLSSARHFFSNKGVDIRTKCSVKYKLSLLKLHFGDTNHRTCLPKIRNNSKASTNCTSTTVPLLTLIKLQGWKTMTCPRNSLEPGCTNQGKLVAHNSPIIITLQELFQQFA